MPAMTRSNYYCLRVMLFFFTLKKNARSAFSFTQMVALYHRANSHTGKQLFKEIYAESNSNGGVGGGGGGGLSKKAYNDDALFNFHIMTQRQKIRDYSAMDTYVNTASLWNLAWHDSFVRNGLADFVPPLTDSLSVLVVGNRYQGPTGAAVGKIIDFVEDEQLDSSTAISAEFYNEQSDSTPIKAAAIDDDVVIHEEAESSEPSFIQQSQDSSCSFLAAVFDDNNKFDTAESSSSSTELELTSYDCIMDRGLMADLCASADNEDGNNNYKNKIDMARLLFEATKRIRECGVYVANTAPISLETKEYLIQLGDYLGLQWEFDLDGISDDNLSVSVARKFGSCPTIGWQTMARMIEE